MNKRKQGYKADETVYIETYDGKTIKLDRNLKRRIISYLTANSLIIIWMCMMLFMAYMDITGRTTGGTLWIRLAFYVFIPIGYYFLLGLIGIGKGILRNVQFTDAGVRVSDMYYLPKRVKWKDVRLAVIRYATFSNGVTSHALVSAQPHAPISILLYLKSGYTSHMDESERIAEWGSQSVGRHFLLLPYNEYTMEQVLQHYDGNITDIRNYPSSKFILSVWTPESRKTASSAVDKEMTMHEERMSTIVARRKVNGQLHRYTYKSGQLRWDRSETEKSQYLYEENRVYCVIHSVPENYRLTFTFDKDNNVTEVKKNTVPVAFYQYDAQGRLTEQSGEFAHINVLKEKGAVTDRGEEIEELMPLYSIMEVYGTPEEEKIILSEEDFHKDEVVIDGEKHILGKAKGYLLFDQYDGHTDYFKYDETGCPYYWIHKGRQYYYRYDKEGRMAYIINDGWQIVGRYEYDEYDNLIAEEGKMAKINPLKDKRYDGKIYNLTVCRNVIDE